MAKRANKGNSNVLDLSSINAIEYNAYAGAKKTLKVGPEFIKDIASNTIKALDASGQIPVQKGTIVYMFNNSATVSFFTMSNLTIGTAPSSLATGVPLAPYQWFTINMGENDFLQTSSANVGVYLVKDDSIYNV